MVLRSAEDWREQCEPWSLCRLIDRNRVGGSGKGRARGQLTIWFTLSPTVTYICIQYILTIKLSGNNRFMRHFITSSIRPPTRGDRLAQKPQREQKAPRFYDKHLLCKSLPRDWALLLICCCSFDKYYWALCQVQMMVTKCKGDACPPRNLGLGLPWRSVVKNLRYNARARGLSPDPGNSDSTCLRASKPLCCNCRSPHTTVKDLHAAADCACCNY